MNKRTLDSLKRYHKWRVTKARRAKQVRLENGDENVGRFNQEMQMHSGYLKLIEEMVRTDKDVREIKKRMEGWK